MSEGDCDPGWVEDTEFEHDAELILFDDAVWDLMDPRQFAGTELSLFDNGTQSPVCKELNWIF